MTDQANGGGTSATKSLKSLVAGQDGSMPSRDEIAIYITDIAAELARIAEEFQLPLELPYLLKMAAISAANFNTCAADAMD